MLCASSKTGQEPKHSRIALATSIVDEMVDKGSSWLSAPRAVQAYQVQVLLLPPPPLL